MSGFRITEVMVEYQKNPLGLDVRRPRISWRMESERQGCRQSAWRILVGTTAGAGNMWDSGRVESDRSIGACYGGATLSPCTRYYVMVTAWNQDNEEAVGEGWFETGLLEGAWKNRFAESVGEQAEAKLSEGCLESRNGAKRVEESAEGQSEEKLPGAAGVGWEGARWIGAPEKYVCADAMGVFVLRSTFQLGEGGKRAGLVFGANDRRLMDARKNQYEIAGENYIRYEIDVAQIPATLSIYRVGYHPDDTDQKPLFQVPIVDKATGQAVITEGNRYAPHELKVEVLGNAAYAYVDGLRVDEAEKDFFWGNTIVPRQLNPLGDNDTTTFPRLCQIGYYVGPGDEAHFQGLSVENLRSPSCQVVFMDSQGIDIQGGEAGCQMVKDPSAHSIPMFRRDFSVEKGREVSRARLYITARGIYDCRINGQAVTDTWLNPGASQFDKHIMYQTYDVTGLLQEGENGIGVTLSSGWWCDAQTFVVRNYNYYGDRESFLAKLAVDYADGGRELVISDPESWDYYGEGPYRYAGFFQGEHLDGRRLREYEDLSLPGYKIEPVGKPAAIEPERIESYSIMPKGFGREWPTVDHSRTRITGSYQAPVVEVCRRSAVSMTEPREGLFLYDLGQEMAGVPSIRLRGETGTEATIRYGEMLYPQLEEYGTLCGMMLTENYRDAESIDRYILRGDAQGEIYCPKFTFHGFRYIEVSGVQQAPGLDEVEGIQLSSIPRLTGEIKTSHGLLNRFIENVRWSQLCNFISIPTDCPQRNERMGWAGDTHVFCRTATYQSDTRLFYYRYLEALRDLQEEDGQLPNIAPVGGGFGGITYESAMILMVWELYQQYGDLEVVGEYFDSMKKWCAFIRREGMPGMAFVGPLGDWLASEETDNHLMWNAFYGYDMELMHRMALALGKQEDAAEFEDLWQEAKAFWNAHFVDLETGKTCGADGAICDTQCSYALPLAYHMFAEEHVARAQGHLARKTRERGVTIGTGFFGTGVINDMLSRGGETELAYGLMLQTAYPSWLYPVTQGATTVWERWNSYTVEHGFGGNNNMNSFNHYSLGSVLSWLYETALGIRRDESSPGYGRFVLEPAMMALDFAEGGIETPYGRINSSWRRTERGYQYECDVPCNATAVVRLRSEGGWYQRELGSGHYCFCTLGGEWGLTERAIE